jgi:tetratricopeptide (TPR) repeat protein
MIIEQHYDEEVLAEFLGEPTDAVTRDKHLASCDLCKRTLHSLRSTARTLSHPSVWDNSPLSTTARPDTLAFLRGMQKNMRDEDLLASMWVRQLLAGPRESWASRLDEHPEWQTAGMVRRLNTASETAVATAPEDALAMAALGVQIFGSTANPSGTMLRSGGLAYYYRGYALWYTGKVMDALQDFDRAEEILEACVGADLDCARVWLIRAMAYQMLERLDDALTLARKADAVFAAYDHRDRVAAARSVIGVTLQEAHRHREALQIHAEVAEMKGISERWRISALNNLGRCYQSLGDYENATQSLVEAIAGFERLGMPTFRSKSRWVLADVFAQQGKYTQALALYIELRNEFEELGMWNDVALASLDAAEVLVTLGRASEIRELCRVAIEYFVANGLTQTEPALRGLAYLQESAAAGRATSKAIGEVRAFLLAPTYETRQLFAEPLQ